jgi:type IV pilus assembly protein PilE
MRANRGFTLLELMIVVGVIAILAAIAYPSYVDQVRKGRRSEAKQVLSDYATREEKWRSNSSTYTSTLSDINGASTTTNGYYTITIALPNSGTCPGGATVSSANSYAITATKAGAQAGDTKCATMVLTSTCGVIAKTSTPSGNTCW